MEESTTKFINITSGNNNNDSGGNGIQQMKGISFSFGSGGNSKVKSSQILKRKEPEKKEQQDNYITTLEGTKISTLFGDEPVKGPKVIPFFEQLNKNYEVSIELNNNNNNNSNSSRCSDNNSNGCNNQQINEHKKIKIEEEKKEEKVSFYKSDATGLQLNPNFKKQEIKSILDSSSNNNKSQDNRLPLIMKLRGIEEFNNEDDKFKFDVESRPEESTEDDYNETPISIFGEAMLRGMGWEPGKSIGQSNKGLVEPIEYIKRPGHRLGLGAKPLDDGPQLAMPEGPDGKVRHVKGIDEKLVAPKRMEEGSLVVVVSGPHQGMNARVSSMLRNDKVEIIFKSEEKVIVEKSDLSLLDVYQPINRSSSLSLSNNSSSNNNKNNYNNSRNLSSSTSLSSSSAPMSSMSMSLSSSYSSLSSSKSSTPTSSLSSSSGSTESNGNSIMWIRPQILVKIISKSLGDGKYYNKKATVVDILGEKLCSLQLYNGVVLENVKQSMLETAIPKAKGDLVIVKGSYKGKIGTLVERRRDHKKEMAIVQLVGDLSILEFDLDDICEYVGNKEIDLYN